MPYLRPLISLLMCFSALAAHAESSKPVLDMTSPDVVDATKPSSDEVDVSFSNSGGQRGVVMTVTKGNESYPGMSLLPPEGVWDLSQYGHVEATVTNIGQEAAPVNLRVDNAKGNNTWNTESTYLKPGETKNIEVIFGHSHGKKPGYKLDPAAISQVLVFTTKPKEQRQILIQSLVAGGPPGEKPPVNPSSIRVKPDNIGFIIGKGIEVTDKQFAIQGDAKASVSANNGAIDIAFTDKDQAVKISPAIGKWDLRDGYQVGVTIKNNGTTAISPKIWLQSKKGSTDGVRPETPIAPGETREVVVSFIAKTPWTGVKGLSEKTSWHGVKGTGTTFVSDATEKVAISPDTNGGEQLIEIVSAQLQAPGVKPPAWVGKRPPVEGDWEMTFNEEFDGDEIDLTTWNIYTPNYWDKRTHFSKDNVVLEDGNATLLYEKKTGHHNDNSEEKVTDYTSGLLDTYGKWVQRYGYFEARMKLPTAPGLWPALWLMPDRGIEEGPQWKRSDIGRGGMEFDIMEYLSRWGHYRYNVAFHWDGYRENHKQTGSTEIYVNHDEDGYITTGLLWLPGYAAIYNNGELVAEWESDRISNVESFIRFTNVSGGWDNNGIQDDLLPDGFVIDYMRCWQRADLASDADGVQSTQPTPAAPTTKDLALLP